MTKEQYRDCKELSTVIFYLLQDKALPNNFIDGLRQLVPDLSDDILSASVNQDCPCKAKISAHIFIYPGIWANYLYNYGIEYNCKDKFDKLISNINTEPLPSLSGKIAETTIEEWKEFVEQIYNEGYQFYNFSVVKEGNKLLVFFI